MNCKFAFVINIMWRSTSPIDIRELLKKESLVSETPTISAFHERHLPNKEEYGIEDIYLVLDSFDKLENSSTHSGGFKWKLSISGATDYNAIGVRNKIENVIEVQIGEFQIPILEEGGSFPQALPAIPSGNDLVLIKNNTNPFVNDVIGTDPPLFGGDTSLIVNAAPYGQYPASTVIQYPAVAGLPANNMTYPWYNNPWSQTPYYGLITMQIKEFGNQGYAGRAADRHQFEFFTRSTSDMWGTNPNMMTVRPRSGRKWDTYMFTEPIRELSQITITFRGPDAPIDFLHDVLNNVHVNVNPAGYLYVNAPNHGMNMGDRFYIKFVGSSTTKNEVLNEYLTRPDGHVAAGSITDRATLLPGNTILSTTRFYFDPAINVNSLDQTTLKLPATVNVYVVNRRIRIPMRIRCLTDRKTNGITPR